MVEKRTEIITHNVLNEVTGQWEEVDKEFVYNESPDGKIKYITHKWCVDMKANYKVRDTFKTSFRDRKETYMYEDAQGNVVTILEMSGIYHESGVLEYTFVKEDNTIFVVTV